MPKDYAACSNSFAVFVDGTNSWLVITLFAASGRHLREWRNRTRAETMKYITRKRQLVHGLFCALLLGMFLTGVLVFSLTTPQEVTQRRRSRIESAAVHISQLIQRHDHASVAPYLTKLVERNPDWLTAGVRSADGDLIAQAGMHDETWAGSGPLATRITASIHSGESQWGLLELSVLHDASVEFINPTERNAVVAVLAVAVVGVLSIYGLLAWLLKPEESADPLSLSRAADKRGQQKGRGRTEFVDGVPERGVDPDCPETTSSDVQEHRGYALEQIGSLIDLSLGEFDGGQCELSPDSLHDLMEQAVAELRDRADELGLSLSYSSDGNLPERMFVDPVALQQAVRNLIGNTIEVTDEGAVSVFSRSAADGEGRIAIDVIGGRTGSPHEASAPVLEASTRSEFSAATSAGGTRFGDFVTRQLVERMGAELTVTSTLDERSCYTITLLASSPVDLH